MDKIVAAVYQDTANGWALVVGANRKPDARRYVVPFIIMTTHSPLFALCPFASTVAVLRTGDLKDATRELVLDHAVQSRLGDLRECGDVLQIARVGTISNIRALGCHQLFENFTMGEEPAFRWLCTCTFADVAKRTQQAARLAQWLIEHHGLNKLTVAEKEAAEEAKLLRGMGRRNYGKSIF
jgi:hypothetical protein